ncbi:MAG: aldo/keto reductase, partial [Phycisphaerales bacterium]|nr:aldo/keto reductase [Hyphomonadaceae bacterium]
MPETTRLGFGIAPFSGSFSSAQAVALLNAAYESGVRHFDTAPIYGWGEGEESVGAFAAGKRDLTIVTKAGMSP